MPGARVSTFQVRAAAGCRWCRRRRQLPCPAGRLAGLEQGGLTLSVERGARQLATSGLSEGGFCSLADRLAGPDESRQTSELSAQASGGQPERAVVVVVVERRASALAVLALDCAGTGGAGGDRRPTVKASCPASRNPHRRRLPRSLVPRPLPSRPILSLSPIWPRSRPRRRRRPFSPVQKMRASLRTELSRPLWAAGVLSALRARARSELTSPSPALAPSPRIILMEAARQGLIPRTTRRLTRTERADLIDDGAVRPCPLLPSAACRRRRLGTGRLVVRPPRARPPSMFAGRACLAARLRWPLAQRETTLADPLES